MGLRPLPASYMIELLHHFQKNIFNWKIKAQNLGTSWWSGGWDSVLLMQGAQVQVLVGKLRSHMCWCGQKQINLKNLPKQSKTKPPQICISVKSYNTNTLLMNT